MGINVGRALKARQEIICILTLLCGTIAFNPLSQLGELPFQR